MKPIEVVAPDGSKIFVRTPEEAVRTLTLLKLAQPADSGGWTPRTFWKFMGSLAGKQHQVIGFLAEEGAVTDEQLRSLLEIQTNQQLAGILSGISKQAAAHGIPARSVFKIEKESKSRKITKTYRLDRAFGVLVVEALAAQRDGSN